MTPNDRRDQARDRQRLPEGEVEILREQREGIGADGIEGDIAEIEQPGEPDHDVEAPAEHHVDQHGGARDRRDSATRTAGTAAPPRTGRRATAHRAGALGSRPSRAAGADARRRGAGRRGSDGRRPARDRPTKTATTPIATQPKRVGCRARRRRHRTVSKPTSGSASSSATSAASAASFSRLHRDRTAPGARRGRRRSPSHLLDLGPAEQAARPEDRAPGRGSRTPPRPCIPTEK